jgi:hypothetical protein
MLMTTVVSIAQFNKLVDYSGLYRMNGTYNNLSGSVLENDSLSERRSSLGYALFDLGIHVSPYKELKVSTILRSRSDIGAFFGTGSIVQFRQIRVEGNIAKVIKYQLGDIDVSMTRYTLYNPEETFQDYESEAFALRRDIVAYENFNYGNNWRMQGAQFETSLLFGKYLERLKAKVLLTRVKKANIRNIPDRYVGGGSLTLFQSKYLQLGGNYISMFDNVGTALDTAYNFANRVITREFKITLESNAMLFNLAGEMGPSYYKYYVANQFKTEKYNDYFYDLGAAVTYKPINLKVIGGYRNIGPLFSSPTAQTMRILPYNTPTELSNVNNNTSDRQATLYDRMTQEGLYNQSIYIGLMQYLPIYGNATPYGPATPNRAGTTIGLSYSDTASIFSAEAKADLLSEIIAEGTSELRKFNVYQGGVKLNLGKLLRLNRAIGICTGIRNEQTTRSGPAPIDFNTTHVNTGINVEVLSRLDLLIGMKHLTGKGNELLAQRDLFNTITSFDDYIIDSKQQILSGGLRYRFFKYSYFSVQYNSFTNKDALSSANDYKWGQIWGNMTLKF